MDELSIHVPPAPAPDVPPTRIVGIGASAGGLESLEQLFTEMPADTGMSFVVVQHLSPDFRSVMDELIARHSAMPVQLAEDGMLVQANRVYLMPPKKEMIIRDRRLILTDKDPTQGLSLPIDQFFRSLAQDQGPQAVAVVLSGSGSDGSRGIIDIKRSGGMVLAESVASAKFDGMPLSAQATGVVDDARLPRDIARILCGLPPLETVEESEPLSEDPAMDAALRLLRDQVGIDFSLYKTSTVARRVQRRADLLRVDSIAAYAEQLRADPDELNSLYQDLLIGVTQFFRDPEAFETLERDVIPQVLDRVAPAQELRVWVAGCATGEEAYSLAMLFHEALIARGRPVNLKILATDVHPMSLEVASTGIYGDHQLAHLTPTRLERYFTKRASGYQISADLRQLIVFARHNVLKDAPFTKMSFISCRNMLIYLQPQAQRTVLSLFHFGLASGGVLFLGASESPGALSDEFTPIDEHWKIYRKRRDVQLLAHLRLPLGHRGPQRTPVPIDLPRQSGADPLILATYDQLLDQFMPPSFLIDEDRGLIDSFGGAERLLKVRRRRMSTSILDLLDGELRTIVAGGIQRAIKDQARVEFTGVRIPDGDGDGERRCTVSIRPLLHPRTGARHLLILLGSASAAAEPAASPSAISVHSVTVDQVSQERLSTLESELSYTKETLQATIEELETSNEEMQATNEELVASNEELQSTNEELHSVNEELYSVNAEYQQKIAELKELNADIQHLLEGTDVGTLFLDRDLRIRRFTPRIASVFHIVQQDLGRQIGDFSHNIERRGLMEDLERVRREGATLEVEVRDRDGTPYFLRILPYRVGNGRDADAAGRRGDGGSIEGVVLTLTDITALDKARSKLAQMSAIVESCDDAIVGKALDGTITSWNRGAERLYGYTAEEAIGRNVSMLMDGPPDELERYLEQVRRGEKVEHVQRVRVRKDGSRVEVSLTISPIWDHDGELAGVSAIARDVTPIVVAQRELELAARRREQFLAMLSHELRNPLAAVLNATSVMHEARFEPGTVERCHGVIGRQSTHMARLLDDLLDVSRIAHGKFELRKQDLDLRGPIEAAIESAAPLLEQRAIALRVALPDAPVFVRGDASRLQQVVVNLLSNAATYSAEGSAVELRLEHDGERAGLEVRDRGIGIAPEMLDQIFELFVQGEQRIDRPRGGLGVGLSLARTVVELHGGTIEALSDGPGHGSRFVVRLPLQPNAIRGRAERRARTRRQFRLAIVEDNTDAREMLRVLLEKRGHVVIEGADGAQGVELIEREHPDAAIVDIGLPVFSGFELARQIRDKRHLDDVVLVALTGYGAPGDVAAAREAGFDHHLCKPAQLAEIEAILEGIGPEPPE